MPALPVEVKWSSIVAGAFANLYVAITYSKDKPIAGVAVALDTKTAITGTDGTCAFTGITVATYTIKCTKAGYQDFTKSVTLKAGGNTLGVKMLTVAETWWDKFVASVEKYWWAYAGGGAVVVALALTRKKH